MIKNCKSCQINFETTDEDLKFYDKVSPVIENKKHQIPAPTLCPECRQQRRMVWRGERKIYHRNCDLCQKPIISIFDPKSPYTVYCRDCWWSDRWDPLSYGREFDFNKTFFEQFSELINSTPLFATYNIEPTNSEYNNNTSYLKNCYLMSSSNFDEDCYYGYFNNDSKNCIDCTSIKRSEICYECVECIDCYNCKYCRNSSNCVNSWFLENCSSCKNCFGCVNLRQKEYCYFNEQLTKEEYENKIAQFHSGSRQAITAMKNLVSIHRLKYPFPFMIGEKNENVSGNCVFQSKDSHDCYDCIQVEDCKFCFQLQNAKDCYDVMTWGRTGELFYECMGTGSNGYNNQFVAINAGGINNLYSYMCMNSKNIFGSVAMKKNTFCVFNKQYSEKDYSIIVEKIIQHMIKTREWGEFFPMSLSPFAYNEAIANDFIPLSKTDAEKIGARWKENDTLKKAEKDMLNPPDDIANAPSDITKKLLTCTTCNDNYRIIDQEISFYQKYKIPVPTLCYQCRHKNRLHFKNPRKLWNRPCAKCKNTIQTSYAPERPEIVYCKSCYLQEIY